MRSRIATLSLCLTLALASAAHARRHHHARHHHVRHHVVRDVAPPPAPLRVALAWNPFAAFAPPSDHIVTEARRWIGTNPTGKARLWCARFMNFVLRRVGLRGTDSDLARSFVHYGHRVAGPQVGAIAVLTRRGGGHVGVVSGVAANGDPIIISGNHGNTTAESVYRRSRVVAYVKP